jgi:hypothetical protein
MGDDESQFVESDNRMMSSNTPPNFEDQLKVVISEFDDGSLCNIVL